MANGTNMVSEKVWVFNIGQMAPNMKAIGVKIALTLTAELSQLMEIVIQANGVKVKHVELVGIVLLMEVFTLEFGKIIDMMVMELKYYLIKVSIRVSFLKDRDTFLVLTSLLMVVCTKEVFIKIKYKEKEYSREIMEKNILVIG